MWAPSRVSSGSGRRTGHRRIADYLADDQTDASDNESFTTAHGDEFFAAASTTTSGVGGGMLPAFLADQSDLVEVMLELDEESMVVRSVTPTLYAPTALRPDGGRSLSRSSSTASLIRRKFAWLRSPSPSTSRRHHHPPPIAAEPPPLREAALAARERRRAQARLDRSRSGARLALKGLRFISCTTATGHQNPAELWRGVEERFNMLSSRDGLLARDDFGACIEQGMEKSKEFAACVFDALARRRRQSLERVTREELYDFWLQISDHSFDARLQIFFDMCAPCPALPLKNHSSYPLLFLRFLLLAIEVSRAIEYSCSSWSGQIRCRVDTNVDGRITREEVQEVN
jgi:respiratory burst oxidase